MGGRQGDNTLIANITLSSTPLRPLQLIFFPSFSSGLFVELHYVVSGPGSDQLRCQAGEPSPLSSICTPRPLLLGPLGHFRGLPSVHGYEFGYGYGVLASIPQP